MTEKIRIKIPRGSRIFPNRPYLSEAELAKRKAEDKAFAQRCREIFQRVYPELVKNHYDWPIMIEPESGDYFVAPDPEIAFQKARQKHPNAKIIEMRLNETGTCGRI